MGFDQNALAEGRPAAERKGGVTFRPFLAGDVVQLALQPSQHVTLGLSRPVLGYDDGVDLADHSTDAWTATSTRAGQAGRILACAGLRWLWPEGDKTKGHAVAWVLLSSAIGADHLAVTRFFGRVVRASPLTRIEAIVRAAVPAEGAFARLCGLSLEADLRGWGPDAEHHQLYARVRK